MSRVSIVPAVAALAVMGFLVAPIPAQADDVPDALSVEWKGKRPCEKLFEDTQIRVLRCTFPPGGMHVCHSHPSYFAYFSTDWHGVVMDEKGTRRIDIAAGTSADIPATPWHEFTNVGDATAVGLLVEKKYQPPPPVNFSVCPRPQ